MQNLRYVGKNLFLERVSIQNFLKKNKLLSDLSLQEVVKIYKNLDKNVLKVFDINNSMNSKRSHGGTSSANVKAMIKKYKKEVK